MAAGDRAGLPENSGATQVAVSVSVDIPVEKAPAERGEGPDSPVRLEVEAFRKPVGMGSDPRA